MPARLLIPLLIVLMPFSAMSAPRPGPAPARITAVTVYPDRAETVRSTTVSLAPGVHRVSMDVPLLMQDDSVRVTGSGSARATILGLEVNRVFVEQVPEKRALELEREIREKERALGEAEGKKVALGAEKAFLESIRVAWGERLSKELGGGRPTAAELKEAMAFVSDGMNRVERQTRGLIEEQERIRESIDALRRQYNEVVGSLRKEAKRVEVEVDVSRAGELQLELKGVTFRAGWEPSYDVRLAPDGASVELVFRAQVVQQTGEDWQGVKLALSTARPAAGGAPPELAPWHVGFHRPMPQPPFPMPMAAAPAMRGKAATAESGGEVMADAAVPLGVSLVEEGLSSVNFIIPRPADIPSDGSRHASVVAVEQMPVSLEFLTVPKLNPTVFLTSRVINRAAYPLLPGRVNVHAGGTFVGSTHLRRIASGEFFELFFGPDDQITVTREELKSHREAGLFGKNRMLYRYRIALRNLRHQPQTVTVRDQIPLAGDQEIKVALEDPSPAPDETREDGRLSWKIPLQAGEKREISFGISVEYPRDRDIAGL